MKQTKIRKVGPYTIGKQIGSGNFSTVRLGTDPNGRTWAIKMIDKRRLVEEDMEDQMLYEIAIMRSLDHPNILCLKDVLQSQNHYYLILELVGGGELFDKIVEAKRLDEDTSRFYFQQLIAGVYHCHSRGFAHRDLKPENLLLDEDGTLKISDFGLGAKQRNSFLYTICGTPNYTAPEVSNERGYNGYSADVWSCGVILYVMLAGRLPFEHDTMNVLLATIQRGEYRMIQNISDSAKNLISAMLTVEPTKRIAIEDIIAHPWFQVGWNPKLLLPSVGADASRPCEKPNVAPSR